MNTDDLTSTACMVFMLCLALLLLITAYALRLPEQEFFDHDAMVHCGRVCHVTTQGTHCVMPCPGPRCLCVRGVGDVWYLDGTIGDDEDDNP